MDVTFLERERVVSTFLDDFRGSINKIAIKRKLKIEFNCFVEKDKKRYYPIDACMKTKEEDLFIFAINSDQKCLISALTILTFEKWGVKFNPVGIFEDQTEISRGILAKFSDACNKQISSLDQIERFEKFIENH